MIGGSLHPGEMGVRSLSLLSVANCPQKKNAQDVWRLLFPDNEYKQKDTSPVWQALVCEISNNIEQNIVNSEARNKYVESILQDFSMDKEMQNRHILVTQSTRVNSKRQSEE